VCVCVSVCTYQSYLGMYILSSCPCVEKEACVFVCLCLCVCMCVCKGACLSKKWAKSSRKSID
jgi:hypothetical protein